MDILPKGKLQMENFGNAFVADKILLELPLEHADQHPAEAAINWLTRENPRYSFSTIYDPKKGGAIVYWRPLEMATTPVDCPTCTTGRNRYTIDMVCPTCGRDFMKE